MLAKQALNTDVEPLSAQDNVSDAIARMKELEIFTLPVIDATTGKLIGQVYMDLLISNRDKSTMADLELSEAVKIYLGQHIFEAARLMLQYEMRLLPVVDEEWCFRGFVHKAKVLESLTHMLNLAESGSVITIELKQRDFTISEVVHLIETEGAKILGITVETPESKEGSFRVSVKLNLNDVSRVAATLRRYDYSVVTDSGNEAFGMDVETRADELIKYLDM